MEKKPGPFPRRDWGTSPDFYEAVEDTPLLVAASDGVLKNDVDWMGLTWAGAGEYAYFRQPTLTTGQRVYAWPTVGWSRQGASWYVTAQTGVHAREYDLNEVRPDVPSRQGYAIPISSVDAGVVFERVYTPAVVAVAA